LTGEPPDYVLTELLPLDGRPCRGEAMAKLKPVTPGELLLLEFLLPMGLSQYRLAKEIGVPAQQIGKIVAGKRAVTADMDLRLCRFFGLSNGYWLRAQAAYDTEVAKEALAEVLEKIKPWTDTANQDRSLSPEQEAVLERLLNQSHRLGGRARRETSFMSVERLGARKAITGVKATGQSAPLNRSIGFFRARLR
jgi:antitoxin HigA-1